MSVLPQLLVEVLLPQLDFIFDGRLASLIRYFLTESISSEFELAGLSPSYCWLTIGLSDVACELEETDEPIIFKNKLSTYHSFISNRFVHFGF